MNTTATQISAYISEETKSQMESYVRRKGVTKAFLIENALQHFLQALRELPEDLVIPARLVLSETSLNHLVERLDHDEEPTLALKSLMAAH